jgi:hypothetical protein
MFAHVKLRNLDDFFIELDNRPERGVYFCRINGYTQSIGDFISRYCEAARGNGVIIEGKLQNPDEKNIAHYNEIMGMGYELSIEFISQSLKKWLPGLNMRQREDLVGVVFDVLTDLKHSGKNDSIVKNTYIKFMCWLYYRFERIANLLGDNDVPKILYAGDISNYELLMMKILSSAGCDIILLQYSGDAKYLALDRESKISDPIEITGMTSFPQGFSLKRDNSQTSSQVETVAYQAERELDTLLYQDTGMFRNMQYGKANSVILKTMYEEIAILWKEELKYRPNFTTEHDMVKMPVIFAKVSGVKDGDIPKYWNSVRELMGEDTLVIRQVPYISYSTPNPIKPYVTGFYKNGKLLKDKIKENANYPYGVLREEMQDHILDKLQLLIDQKTIKGTGENGTEYTIISTALNMSKGIVRVIQKFDFTKKNPKLIYINTGENIISIEDSILTAFLSLIGFDVVFFVPTGYQSVEKYFNYKLIEEHQMGNYVYDMAIPDLTPAPSNNRKSLRDRLFNIKKGV